MTNDEIREELADILAEQIEQHKRVDVNALSDDGWRQYQQDRRAMLQRLDRLQRPSHPTADGKAKP